MWSFLWQPIISYCLYICCLHTLRGPRPRSALTWAEPQVWLHRSATLCSWRGWLACPPAAGSAPFFSACSGRWQTSDRMKWSHACDWRWLSPSHSCACPLRWSQLFNITAVLMSTQRRIQSFRYCIFPGCTYSLFVWVSTWMCGYNVNIQYIIQDHSIQYHRCQRGCSTLDTHIHIGWRSPPSLLAARRTPALLDSL